MPLKGKAAFTAALGPKKKGFISSVKSKGGSSGGGFGGANLSKLLAQFQQSQGQQQGAILKAQQQAAKLAQKQLMQAQKQLEKVGTTGFKAIAKREKQGFDNVLSQLIGQGLGNTTVVQQQQGAVTAQANDASNALTEQLAALKSGLFQQQAQSQLGIGQFNVGTLQGLQQGGPQFGDFLQLIQMLGGGGGGGGF